MRTSSKKTYPLAGVFVFVLMLTIALLISFAMERICQKQTQLIVFETTDTHGTATAISQPEEDAVLNAKPVPSESVCLKETPNVQENNTLSLEATQPETVCPVVTEAPVETQVTTASEEKRSFAEMELLFIGDSRTVGLADYATIENAHFFSAIGMSVYNVGARSVAVPKIGKITLDELLNHKQYDIIYIMLGINELGYAFEKTVAQYEQLVESVKQLQPDAIVILMANLHVTSERSKTDKYINNPAIDRFNNATARLADTKTVFYLDANSLFDDKDGNLDKGKSADNAHLKAKCYVQWADWLKNETSEIILRIEGEKVTDKEYFCECIRQCENGMYKLAMGILKNETDAEDAMQNAILKAYCNLDQLKDRKKFRSWIFSIVHNCAIECVRKQKNIIDIEEEPFLVAPESPVDISTKLTLWEAVQKLKAPYSTVIILFYYEDYSILQISSITNTHVNTVKKQLSRARAMLAKLLHKEDFVL